MPKIHLMTNPSSKKDSNDRQEKLKHLHNRKPRRNGGLKNLRGPR